MNFIKNTALVAWDWYLGCWHKNKPRTIVGTIGAVILVLGIAQMIG